MATYPCEAQDRDLCPGLQVLHKCGAGAYSHFVSFSVESSSFQATDLSVKTLFTVFIPNRWLRSGDDSSNKGTKCKDEPREWSPVKA